ncbi:MAG: HD domain-containing protein, partial [Candidatus Aureabacteria bacterium]|nr:HD domain-containing protein [Candidatus Auribacterota bacterium]
IGKIYVPAEILSKPSKLNDLEMNIVKLHPEIGHEILSSIEFPWPITRIILEHHERIDGSGYPRGIKGRDMLLESKILSVADVVEAMASHRPYRPSLGMKSALEEICKNKGRFYDRDVVEACVKVLTEV